MLNENNEVVSAYDYDAWGYVMENRSYESSLTKYKFTGKERDNESMYDYFGARYYDSRIGRWGGVDNLQSSYISFSPYCYGINNPMNLIDPNGLKIDFSQVGDEYRDLIISDLKLFTGLNLYIDDEDYLQIGDGSVSEGNISSIAREYLEKAILSEEVLTIGTSLYISTKAVEGRKSLNLNPNEINSFISGASGILNTKTLGWGMNFIHEMLHTSFGFGIGHENETSFGDIGLVVQTMNKIRAQIGSDYGQRLSYGPLKLTFEGSGKVERYLPFDKESLNVMNKIINEEKLHKIRGMYIKY